MSNLSSPQRTHLVELIVESSGRTASLENGIVANRLIGLPVEGSNRLPTYTTYSLSERSLESTRTARIPSYTTYKTTESGALEKVVKYGSSISYIASAPAPPSPTKDLRTNKPELRLRSRTDEGHVGGPFCAPCTQ
jgi:hypothetical protein